MWLSIASQPSIELLALLSTHDCLKEKLLLLLLLLCL
jgi:hypothetical protein